MSLTSVRGSTTRGQAKAAFFFSPGLTMIANETKLIADATAEYQSFVTKKLSDVTRQGIAGDLCGYRPWEKPDAGCMV